MFNKVLIANRGEIALRVLRACKELNIKTVAVYSTSDRFLKHVLLADETICIGPANSLESYLNIPSIISAAEITGSDAIHPGYGFLSENYNFAEQVEKSGFIFIGPNSNTLKLMGDKISAISVMKKIGMPCLPTSFNISKNNIKKNTFIANKIGYPIVIKASKGGGGRAMKIVYKNSELEDSICISKSESKIAFNDDSLYFEKYIENAKHIEIQVLSDGHGNAEYLVERDCSIQRRYQKILEESPSVYLNKKIRNYLGKFCIKACLLINYKGVGTFEFLYKDKNFYFIEMNTRIQVEHPVTEMVTGIDIVKEQLKIAYGEKLNLKNKINFSGHAIECRINAEDPKTFLPNYGKISRFHAPGGLGVRWESHIYSGYNVPAFYDTLIGKLICFGENRKIAISKMKNALEEIIVDGIKTNINLHLKIINNKDFLDGDKININFLSNFNF
ncbi:accC [Wigglesworthia glossinidia endosymbiont of Glossina brevipalpis]|uniref:Biotin carboxylase n=1 Tax=Wigglesworthia glossinidia brevipalpis TaxID=36870 RepID=Q8D1V3_WIGBR|nr:accC [Wigglesworthia glossinidia endosymbiont of Glossina brevipalpis]